MDDRTLSRCNKLQNMYELFTTTRHETLPPQHPIENKMDNTHNYSRAPGSYSSVGPASSGSPVGHRVTYSQLLRLISQPCAFGAHYPRHWESRERERTGTKLTSVLMLIIYNNSLLTVEYSASSSRDSPWPHRWPFPCPRPFGRRCPRSPPPPWRVACGRLPLSPRPTDCYRCYSWHPPRRRSSRLLSLACPGPSPPRPAREPKVYMSLSA